MKLSVGQKEKLGAGRGERGSEGGAIMLRSKPDWTSDRKNGVPVHTVVHVKASASRDDDTKQLVLSRNAVSVLKPGRARPEAEDEFVVDAVFGQDASASDVARNCIAPLVSKLVDGENVFVYLFGATDTSKSDLLEGGDPSKANLVELAAGEIFKSLSAKNKEVMDYLSSSKPAQGGRHRQYDFFVESSFAEVYNERCRCLFSSQEVSVSEDEAEGFRMQGAAMKPASDAQELEVAYKRGLSRRDKEVTDIGATEERTSTVFTISVDQLVPPGALQRPSDPLGRGSSPRNESQGQSQGYLAKGSQSQTHLKSKLTFVNLAGTERLLMDPDVLRAREGVSLNKSLLTFAQCLRRLGSGEYGPGTDFLAEESVLTQLVQEGLGGNSHCLIIATLKTDSRHDWQQNIATMRYVDLARRIRTFPCRNDEAVRALFRRLRARLLRLKDQREELSENLRDVLAFGDVDAGANYAAKLHQMERLLMEEKERGADLLEEIQALQSRLGETSTAGQKAAREKIEIQEALIKSEEERLEIAKALIDFQVEHNQGAAEAERTKFDLEKRVLELETQAVEREVKEGEHERAEGELKGQAQKLEEEKRTYLSESEKLADELAPLKEKVKQLKDENEDFRSKSELYDAALDENRHLRTDNARKETRVEELQSEATDIRRETDRLRNELSLMRLERDGAQETHHKQLEGLFQEVSELNRFVRLSYTDPDSEVVTARGIASPAALSDKSEELLQALEDLQVKRHKTLRAELESVQHRCVRYYFRPFQFSPASHGY